MKIQGSASGSAKVVIDQTQTLLMRLCCKERLVIRVFLKKKLLGGPYCNRDRCGWGSGPMA